MAPTEVATLNQTNVNILTMTKPFSSPHILILRWNCTFIQTSQPINHGNNDTYCTCCCLLLAVASTGVHPSHVLYLYHLQSHSLQYLTEQQIEFGGTALHEKLTSQLWLPSIIRQHIPQHTLETTMVLGKRTISNPALCQQLDESSWMMTPPGAHRKRLGEFKEEYAGMNRYHENEKQYLKSYNVPSIFFRSTRLCRIRILQCATQTASFGNGSHYRSTAGYWKSQSVAERIGSHGHFGKWYSFVDLLCVGIGHTVGR